MIVVTTLRDYKHRVNMKQKSVQYILYWSLSPGEGGVRKKDSCPSKAFINSLKDKKQKW